MSTSHFENPKISNLTPQQKIKSLDHSSHSSNTQKISSKLDDKNILFHDGNSPLFLSCLNGHNEIVKMLLEKYQLPVNKQNHEGETPLALCVKNGDYDVVCTLLDYGANPNISNLRAETPLHLASCFGYTDICKELIKFGGWIDAEDDCGDTPLHWAVREEQIEIVQILLALGANPFHENEDEESPMKLAESVGSDSLVNVFDAIASTDGNDVDGEVYGLSLVSSNDIGSIGVPKEIEPTLLLNSMDYVNSDDSSGGNVDFEVIDTSGTVYPSSLGKEDEYIFLAGKDDKNPPRRSVNNNNKSNSYIDCK
jgi:ankyrin repeat protein